MAELVRTNVELASAAGGWGFSFDARNTLRECVQQGLNREVPFSAIERGNLQRIAQSCATLVELNTPATNAICKLARLAPRVERALRLLERVLKKIESRIPEETTPES